MRAIFPLEDEAPFIRDFFGGVPGFFVDVGANDPEAWSQTFHLEQLGWTGVLVEPQPDLAEQLRQRRNAKVYAVACSSPANHGTTMVLNLAGAHTSLEPGHHVFGMQSAGTLKVPVTTLDRVLTEAAAPVPVDYVSIDVEGHEIEVLAGFDLERWRPRLIMVEDHAQDLRLHRSLTARGYKWVRRTRLNGWYVPAHSDMRIPAYGRLQFVRKYYLGLPFRRARDRLRRLRERLRRRPMS